jgi:hypothetical protein
MTTHVCEVIACDLPAPDATVCVGCGRKLRFNLMDVPELVPELETTLARHARIGGQAHGSRSAEIPLVFDIRASEVGHAFRGTLQTWVRLVHDEKYASDQGKKPLPEDRLSSMAGWLVTEVDWLRMHEIGHDAVTEILQAIASVRRLIDRPPGRVFLGICSAVHAGIECTEPLYGLNGRHEVRCRTCGTEHQVEERREVLRDSVEDVLARPAEICRAVIWLDEHVRADQITRWQQAGRLLPKGHDEGKPRYRIGDVLDLLAGNG